MDEYTYNTNATGTGSDAASGDERLRKVELVREKTGVTYEEARAALELTSYDVLDAVVLLERQGKTAQKTASYATPGSAATDDVVRMSQAQSDYEQATKKNGLEETLGKIWDCVKRMLRKSIDITFVATRRGHEQFSIPLLLFLILFVFAFWIVVPLLVIGLFFEFRYRFNGIGALTVDINDLSDKASDGVDYLKREVMGPESGSSDSAGKNDTGMTGADKDSSSTTNANKDSHTTA